MAMHHELALIHGLPERWLPSQPVLSESRIARLRERLIELRQKSGQPAPREDYLFLLGDVLHRAERQPELLPLLKEHESALEDSRAFRQACIERTSVAFSNPTVS